MDEPTFRALIRAELNIPAGLSPEQRAVALDEAFRTPQNSTYSTSFQSFGGSAQHVLDFLQSNRFGTFEVARIGRAGNFKPEGFDTTGVRQLVVPGPTPLHVEFFSYLE